jgi:hypothetical protein
VAVVGEVNLWEMSPSHPLGPLLSGWVYSLLFAGNIGDVVISSRFMDPLDVYGTGHWQEEFLLMPSHFSFYRLDCCLKKPPSYGRNRRHIHAQDLIVYLLKNGASKCASDLLTTIKKFA